jgi:glutamate carboxypeptidase
MTQYTTPQYDHFLQDLESLVNVDSCSDDHQGILEVGLFLKERLLAAGLQAHIVALGKEKTPCLEAVSTLSDTYDVLLLGHMDTVFPKGTASTRPFTVKDNRAYGPGVSDMKAGLLVALYAVEAMSRERFFERFKVRVAFNGDEETGSHNSRDWIRDSAKTCKRVLVFEPCRPGWGFVLDRKGGGAYTITAKGKASHAGVAPELGVNALLAMAYRLQEIHRLTNWEKGTTVMPTVMHSGDKDNVIPDLATAKIDVRFSEVAEMERLEQYFSDLSGFKDQNGARFKVLGGIEKPPMNPNPETLALWQLLMEEGRRFNIKPERIFTGGCSDGNYTAALGIPTMDGMGAVGSGAHTENEHVELNSIIPMIQLVFAICRRLSAAKPLSCH